MTPALEVRGLVKDFPRSGRLFGRPGYRRAVDHVSFTIQPGQTFGLVGESGSGKTTTGRCVLRLTEPTAGEIRVNGVDIRRLARPELQQMRRHMQIIFQDPFTSLNPRMRVGRAVEEPLIIHRVGTRAERTARVCELFDLVGLDPSWRHRYPHEFSGGQRQRIGIARAIALHPSLVVADEPVSALDASSQRHIVRLLADLQRRLGLAYLFITHDLRLIRRIADLVGVMYRGRLVEVAAPDALFSRAAHPYTRALLSAMPRLTPDAPAVERLRFDPDRFAPGPLREIEAGHFAAV